MLKGFDFFKFILLLFCFRVCFVDLFVSSACAKMRGTGRVVAGEVVSVSGVVMLHSEQGKGQSVVGSLQAGDLISVGDWINTGTPGSAKFLLKDRSIVDLGPGSLFKVSEFEVLKAQGQSVALSARAVERAVALDVEYGSIRTAVTEKLKGQSRFRVRTPGAVMGIRGTVALTDVKLGEDLRSARNAQSSFFVSQGEAQVISQRAGSSRGSTMPLVLHPGEQATLSRGVGSGSGAASVPLRKEVLTPTQVEQKMQTLRTLSSSSDTTFVMATHFDRVVEQRSQSRAPDRTVASAEGGATSGGQAAARSSNTRSTSAGGGGMFDAITAQVTQVAVVPPQITSSNLAIAGAPTNLQVLTQQSGPASVLSSSTRRLTVNVVW
jgi:hypothetical protein